MRQTRCTCLISCFLIAFVGLAFAQEKPASDARAPLFNNLGKHQHKVTTGADDAQRYFNQGLTFVYGFNHHEAIRSFKEAARLDPECAMAWWGIALAYGLNINAPMMEDAVPRAYEAIQQAQKLAPKAGEQEQAYIRALAKRYTEAAVMDRAPLEKAYAEAMREVAKRYPDDLDALTLFAEALMNTMPWNYWTKDGKPQPGTDDILAALESVLQRDPNHPGANHYLIHAVEASPHPERGLAAAYRLGDLCPGAGHLVHMPSHIYLRLGFYQEAVVTNEKAIAADESYISHCKAQGFYPVNYYAHNIHFLWHVLAIQGRCADSIRAGRKAGAVPSEKEAREMTHLQWIRATPLLALARFGRWDEVLREPQPAAELHYETAMSRYARGLAFVRTWKLDDAVQEAGALDKLARSKDVEALETQQLPGATLIRLANSILAAETEGLRGSADGRVKRLDEAVRMEDDLPYMEPPYWYHPVRQMLGAAQLEAGQPAKAEAVYRDDLKRWPRNGWSLYGLLQSLRKQAKTAEAADVQRQFQEAWKYADVTLTASCF